MMSAERQKTPSTFGVMSAPLSHAVRRIATTTIVMNTSDQMMRWARISKAPMPCKAWKYNGKRPQRKYAAKVAKIPKGIGLCA